MVVVVGALRRQQAADSSRRSLEVAADSRQRVKGSLVNATASDVRKICANINKLMLTKKIYVRDECH